MKSTLEEFALKLSTDMNEITDNRDKKQNIILEFAVKTLVGTPMESGTGQTHKHDQDCDLTEVISLLGETRLAKSLNGGHGDSDWLVDMIKGYNGKMV